MKDRLLLPLILFLLRNLTPVGRVGALLALNRLVDGDLEAETEKPGECRLAGEEEATYESLYHVRAGR